MSNIYAERNIKSKNDEWQMGFDFNGEGKKAGPDYEPVDRPEPIWDPTAAYLEKLCEDAGVVQTAAEKLEPCPDLEAVQTKIDYESLRRVLEAAYDQASMGKGKERHAGDGLAFIDQPMQAVSKLLNTSDGLAFQAIKKVTESQGMKTFEQKERELLGAIVYIAGMIIFEQNRPTI
jgi:hypothetical protein